MYDTHLQFFLQLAFNCLVHENIGKYLKVKWSSSPICLSFSKLVKSRDLKESLKDKKDWKIISVMEKKFVANILNQKHHSKRFVHFIEKSPQDRKSFLWFFPVSRKYAWEQDSNKSLIKVILALNLRCRGCEERKIRLWNQVINAHDANVWIVFECCRRIFFYDYHNSGIQRFW